MTQLSGTPQPIKAGLIGTGIQASLTPAMHMREGQAQGLAYEYRLLDMSVLNATLADLPALLDRAEAEGFAGLNITHPCKQAVIAHLHTLSGDAASLGAVNTVVFQNGRRIGHNTDWWGFAESFRRGLPQAVLGQVVQLGAGGAGAAVAHAALMLGAAQLTIFDTDQARAEQLAAALAARFTDRHIHAGTDLAAAMAQADGLIHATPTGMAKYPGLPLPETLLQARHWVAEIVYFPLQTALVKLARQRGCAVLDGGGMAVFQAVEAFRLITGLEPDAERMLAHFAELTQPKSAA